jgi:bifunctional non-homologous end joining protein LigD
MNHLYKPMLAKETNKAFNDKDWLFEVKWDGFRAIAYVNNELSLRSRNNKELKFDFPELEELIQLTHDVVLDGEIIMLNKGKVTFQTLLEKGKKFSALKTPAVYVVFDILEKEGKSLVDLPLIERKKILKTALREGQHVILSDFVEELGLSYFQIATQKGLEGIMAKKKDGPYRPGLRSDNWLKIKMIKSCDCLVFGYTKGTGLREKTFGALLLGLYDTQGNPIYVGKVGTGFSKQTLDVLYETFRKIKTEIAPFNANIIGEFTWLVPQIVCEIRYQVVTPDMKLRLPRFERIRSDKLPSDCTIDQVTEQPLEIYNSKRNFENTVEPKADIPNKKDSAEKIFVVQEHHSRRLHYDFRLERDGVLKSWAVPKGIPEKTEDKRLAVQVEDHPLAYAQFEGEIPKGEYGAGQVIIWDKGFYQTKVWEPKIIEFILHGKKLNGKYVLVPLSRGGNKNWLMLKGKE